MKWCLTLLVLGLWVTCFGQIHPETSLFQFDNNQTPRWSSPENRNGVKGAGGKENYQAKGHPYDSIPPGKSYSLLDIQGQGMIQRIWVTINDRSPEMLRSLVLRMYWDGQSKPAVEVPFGDFFCMGTARMVRFENALFTTGEGRSFVSYLTMPFRKGAKITLTNESSHTLHNLFYDVDYSYLRDWDSRNLYFHAYWHRDTATFPGKAFELLPGISGRGRFLGVNVGVQANPRYPGSWFGEGEVKMYLDGDQDFPTLNGTGTEDYIGSAWGQGAFINRFNGCTVAEDSTGVYAFYRFHIPDPIFFRSSCKVVLQQMGGAPTDSVASYQKKGAPLIVAYTDDGRIHPQFNPGKPLDLNKPGLPKGWTNFYRSDDVSSTVYFYLDSPTDPLPPLQPVFFRCYHLRR